MTGAGRTTVALAAGAGMLLLSVHVLRSRLAVIRVTGASMTPAFADGDRLLVRRTTRVRRGDAVVFRNPVPFGDGDDALAWLVKRVSALPGDAVPPDVREIVGAPDGGLVPPGSLIVRGDAARTQDSRHFGYVPQESLLGVVLTRPTPLGRS
ncbi:S26 family signal peptidase [Streptomyces mirabilis]|uniref:S26 family signal peptidase n=1 Tax=Streptomyces mirabilis TaxID=68239 RepID=UPI003695111F